jgi:hypothetical protein
MLPLAGAGLAVVGVACCAGLPVLATAVGGLTVAAVLGVAGGVLLAAAVIVVGVLVLRSRRRRRCAPPTKRPAP